MADFLPAYEAVILAEGGYRLTNRPNDRGRQTYAGISRRSWPHWPGWIDIDAGRTPDVSLVRNFYEANFWNVVRGNDITSQRVAECIYGFAVNAGVATAVKLTQLTVGTTPDGRMGPVTLARLNDTSPEVFTSHFTLAKIARYRDICMKDRTQVENLLGWINRALKEAA